MEKLTQRQFFTAIINSLSTGAFTYESKGTTYTLTNDEIVAFANSRISALDKKNKSVELSETTIELRENAQKVLEFLAGKSQLSFREIRENFGWSPQKANPIMKYLVDNDKVNHTYEKRVNYYSLKG